MCNFHHHDELEPLDHDEWLLDTPVVRQFVAGVRETIARTASAEEACSVVEPSFVPLLANDTGCVVRHIFDEVTGEARPFRSGYVNADCVPTG